MTSNSKTTNEQLKQELDDIDDRLRAAERYASRARKHEDAFWSRVYQALLDIYTVWHPLLNSEHLIEAYCIRHQIPFNSTKKANRFYAPIQHCFRSARSDSSIVHYADTLKEADRLGKTPNELVKWIEECDGPDGVYQAVAARRKAARAAQAAASHPPISAPQPTAQHSQPQAGAPPSAASQPASMPAAAPSSQTAPAQPLNTIGLVVDAIRTIDQLVNGKDDCAILIRNVANDGSRNLCVENTGTRQTFTTARITLPFVWSEIGNQEYVLSHREAERLSRSLSHSHTWNVDACVDELRFQSSNGHRIVAPALSDMDEGHRHMAVPSGHGSHLKLAFSRAREYLMWIDDIVRNIRIQSKNQRREAHEQIEQNQDILSNLWRQQRSVRVGQRTTVHVPASNRLLDHRSFDYVMPGKTKLPRALDLLPSKRWVLRKDIDPSAMGDEGEEMVALNVLEVNLFATYRLPFPTWADNMKCQPFDASNKVYIGEDVRLPTTEVSRLCRLLVTSGNDASVQFINTDEAQAALLAEFAHGGEQVRYMIPTIKSASLLRRQACQPLVRSLQLV